MKNELVFVHNRWGELVVYDGQCRTLPVLLNMLIDSLHALAIQCMNILLVFVMGDIFTFWFVTGLLI